MTKGAPSSSDGYDESAVGEQNVSVPLPDSWVLAPLVSIAEINPRSFCTVPTATQLPVHFVPMSAVTQEFGGIDVSATRLLAEVQKGYTTFLAHDVLFAKITPCMENGKLAVVPPLPYHIAFGSTEFHVLRATPAAHPAWLAYFLSQTNFRKLARWNMTGSAGQMRVATTWLSAADIPVAPIAEQARILEKLEELLPDLDAGIAELQTARNKLLRYRQSLLKAAVDGTLTASWRETQSQRPGEPEETGAQLLERILTERRARWEAKQLAKFKDQGKEPPKGWNHKYPEPKMPEDAYLRNLPESWVWATVEQLGPVQLGRQRSPSKMKGECPAKYIRAANITESGIDFSDVLEMDFSDTERDTFRLRCGDVLLTAASGSAEHVGRPVIWPSVDDLFCFQNTVIRFSPRGIASKFAFYVFLAARKPGVFQQLSGGVGINHLSAGKFAAFAVPLPPAPEQEAIIDALEIGFSFLDGQSAAIAHSLRQSAAQRQNILKAAFSGQLVPQDPNDEPAAVLLERIRAERAAAGTGSGKRGRKARALS